MHDMPMQAQRVGGDIGAAHLQPATTRRWVVSITLRPLYLWEIPGTHCTGGWVGLGAVLHGTENLAPTGIQSLNCPARSPLLYRLYYPGRRYASVHTVNVSVIAIFCA